MEKKEKKEKFEPRMARVNKKLYRVSFDEKTVRYDLSVDGVLAMSSMNVVDCYDAYGQRTMLAQAEFERIVPRKRPKSSARSTRR